MRVTLVVPRLLAMERAALAAVPALARLAEYAGGYVAEPEGVAVALLAAAGVARDTAIAPLAALGAGFDPESASSSSRTPSRWWRAATMCC